MNDVDWVTLGPHPHFATCQRCGAHEPAPKLPMELGAFVRYIDKIGKSHRKCKEVPGVEEAATT